MSGEDKYIFDLSMLDDFAGTPATKHCLVYR